MWNMLMDMSTEMNRAEALGNSELLDEVLSTVWGDLEMNSRESAILEELVRRFKDKAEVDTKEVTDETPA